MAPISFNGQTYASPDDMPPDVRQLYDMAAGMLADKNGDGVPDLFEGVHGTTPTVSQTTHIVVDGQVYTSADDLPPEARQRLAQAMGRLDADGDGVPDLLAAAAPPAASPAATQAAPAATPHVTVVGAGGGPSPAWLAAITVIVLLAAAVLYLLLAR